MYDRSTHTPSPLPLDSNAGRPRLLAVALASALLGSAALGACTEPLADGLADPVSCSSCHGDQDSAAPPRALNGHTSRSELGVGAHRAHVTDGPLRQALACDACHVTPEEVGDPGHVDPLPAEITWGELARAEGSEPHWLRDEATCATTYCHGATLTGGTNTRPVWTATGQARCGTCHGNPPPAPHPQVARCQACHPSTVAQDGSIDVAGGHHIDGVLQVGEQDCNSCHGGADNPAPPVSVLGLTDTTEVAVGAHQRHLADGAIRQAIACDECHVVPDSPGSPGHIDAPPAELRFGSLATAQGADPAWDHEQATCSTTYCHGATLEGGQATAPVWNRVDGTQAQCDSCHGAPPPSPHPQNPRCHACHPDTVRDDGSEYGAIDVAGGAHIDGQVQVNTSCNSCHGSEANPAPPQSVDGLTETTDLPVGAHQAHVTDGAVRAAVPCASCHVVPAAVGDEGHMDAPPAEVTFTGLAVAGGATPSWDRDQATCSTTYCHGATLQGGAQTEPTWTQVDGSQAQCGSCHGAPPPLPHPPIDQCATCHPETVRSDGTIDVEGGHHIDGFIDAPTPACNACHGDATTIAPPKSLLGETETTATGVGAHRAHLLDGPMREAVPCSSCHQVPSSLLAEGHMDTPLPAELTWGPLATADGAQPTWDHDQVTCSATYCHGATLTGGTNTEPRWTSVGQGEAACGTCHGTPPPSPHPQAANCRACHPGTIKADGTIDVEGGLHIDGVVQAPQGACTACHGTEGQNAAPPMSTQGSQDPAEIGVGAHQAHMQAGPLRQALACSECHTVPTSVDAPGHADSPLPAELTWGPLASAGLPQGTSPTWDRDALTCSNVYCHGATLSGGSNTTPTWTTADGPDPQEAACGACHGAPPPSPHPAREDCSTCHPDTVRDEGTIDVEGGHHINGTLEVPALTCTACHGQPTEGPAPPVALDGATEPSDPRVGAHQVHLSGSEIAGPVECSECHQVPSFPEAAGHYGDPPADLTWGALATTDGASPTYAPGASAQQGGTCSNVYCHGATLSGGTLTEPVWNDTSGDPRACDACHGAPPPSPHPNSTACELCHPNTVVPDGAGGVTIDLVGGLHLNGKVDVAVDCDACHGAPPATGSHLVHYAGLAADVAYGDTRDTEDFQAAGLGTGGGYTFGCGSCHPMDPTHHMNGVLNAGGGAAEVSLTPDGAPAGTLRARNAPDASYTPGDTVQTDAAGFAYTTGGTCSNVYCHSAAAPSVPGPVPEPGTDFPFASLNYPIDYPPYEVNYARAYATPTWGGTVGCDSCHGLPPRTSVPDVQAGAADSHSWIDADGYENLHGWNHGFDPIPCAACHADTVTDFGVRSRTNVAPANGWSVYEPIPITDKAKHVNGQPDVAFTDQPVDVKTAHDLTTATYDPADKSCSNVSCHIKETKATWGAPYRYLNLWECDRCHQY